MPPCDDEQRWLCGDEGEEHVAAFLARRLGDEWTLLQGYFNDGGEIDAILVGPSGVHAVEIKHQKGTFYCEDNRWTRDKYDRYGNKVTSREPMQDRKGRSPSQQLIAPANSLQAYLDKPLPGTEIRKHVLFSHPDARLASVIDPRLDSISHINDPVFLDQLNRVRQELDPATLHQMIALIRKSHENHKRARKPRSRHQSGGQRGSWPAGNQTRS